MDHNYTNFNITYKISNIKEVTGTFLTNNNYTVHNENNTYYINQNPISCIDHIYSNCPHKVTHVTTHNTGQSDYSILTSHYNTKAPITLPKLIYTRQKHLLTEYTLNQYLSNNDILQTIYTYTDPDLIAEIMMSEYNNIIDIVSPHIIRQVQKNYTPYINKNLDIKNNTYINST